MKMIWGVLLIMVSGSLGSPVTSPNIKVKCEEYYDIAPESFNAPSKLKDLKASLIKEEGRSMLNISWALNIDNTLKNVEATEINIDGNIVKCEYSPPLANAIILETEQIWFHYLKPVFSADEYNIQAANIPLPPYENGLVYQGFVLKQQRKVTASTVKHTVLFTNHITTPVPDGGNIYSIVTVPVGGSLIILLFCLMIYKNRGVNFGLGFKKVATSPKVPIVVVYPAENLAFQCAIVALAEFLQQQTECSVAIDMWQQENIAKLGPLRWLMEQVKAAERVLVVCPQSSLQPEHLPQKPVLPGACIPAAAQDLYPLALNIVASHAKNYSELAKFWVVQLGDTGALASELKVCRTFCLMKDLNKLCRCLQNQRPNNKMKVPDLFLRRGAFYSKKSTEKLHAAVQALNAQHGCLTK